MASLTNLDQLQLINSRYKIDQFKPLSINQNGSSYSLLPLLHSENRLTIRKSIEADAECTELIFKRFRRGLLSNFHIEMGKQGKHIPTHPHYITGKSIFEHPDPQKLIDEFAGLGRKIKSPHPGEPGYVEKVDFNVYIGKHIDEKTKKMTLTSWGKIHYSKHGSHIVPALPDEISYD